MRVCFEHFFLLLDFSCLWIVCEACMRTKNTNKSGAYFFVFLTERFLAIFFGGIFRTVVSASTGACQLISSSILFISFVRMFTNSFSTRVLAYSGVQIPFIFRRPLITIFPINAVLSRSAMLLTLIILENVIMALKLVLL